MNSAPEPTVCIRNWQTHQHYHNRRPPWIKLHRGLLDDPEYHALSDRAARFLPLLWILASESKTPGELPCAAKAAFRLHLKTAEYWRIIEELHGWLATRKHDASMMLAPCKHDASNLHQTLTPEGEGEGETEREPPLSPPSGGETDGGEFGMFWASYPRKVGKLAAQRAWKASAKKRPPIADVLAAIHRAKKSPQWSLDGGQFIPHPSTWINQGRWDDEDIGRGNQGYKPNPSPSDAEQERRQRHDAAVRFAVLAWESTGIEESNLEDPEYAALGRNRDGLTVAEMVAEVIRQRKQGKINPVVKS